MNFKLFQSFLCKFQSIYRWCIGGGLALSRIAEPCRIVMIAAGIVGLKVL
jgi:hypothetical protein